MSLLHILVIAPFIIAIFVPFIYRWFRQIHTGWFVLPLPLILFLYLFQFVPIGNKTFEPIKHSFSWVPSLGIHFDIYLDGLSLLFALLITGIGTLVVLYSIYYIKNKQDEPLNNFYVFLLMFMGAMLGVVLSDNLIVVYVFWELTSISSALLIAYWFHKEKSKYGAQKSMLITVFGGLTMLAGFSLLYVMTGTFSIREIILSAGDIVTNPLFIPAMVCILIGAFTKSAQFPFHIWLPDAMEAPTPVSAYLHSATMVKAGIYLVARLTPVFGGTAQWFWIVTIIGLITLIWGAVSAIRQKDLKAILAFSTVSQLGMIMSMIGMGSAALHYELADSYKIYSFAIIAAIFHLINHATFKGALFMVVGIIDHKTGTRDIRKLGGLLSIMPITFTVSVIGAASMAGLPPFNGFLSKEMFFTSVLRVANLQIFNVETIGFLIPVVAWIASIFTFIYSTIIVVKTFLGKYQPEKLEKEPKEAPFGMLLSPIILVALVVFIGLFPNSISRTIIEPAVQAILPSLAMSEGFVNIQHWHGFTTELWMTLGVIAIGIILFMNLKRWQETTFFLRERDPLNWIYDRSLDGLVNGSIRITDAQMTGVLRDYFVYMFVFIIIILAWTFVRFDSFAYNFVDAAEISPFLWVIALVMIAAVISIPMIQHRIAAIIMTGVVGFMVALLFVVLKAPDLALTQLLIETATTIMLLLCFYHLPELKKEDYKPRKKMTNLLVSIGVGVTFTVIGISVFAMRHSEKIESISNYYIENSKILAGGYNIVNVILVDFRGFDTMFEILVLGIAALGVVSLIKLRLKGGEDV